MLDKATKTDSRVKRIGWGKQTLKEMLLTSERLFAETGHYYGQKLCRSEPKNQFSTRRCSRICAEAW